jgi:hypothetical protein
LPFRRGHDSLRHLPLQTDGELKHHQRCNHPVCRSVTHDPQRTLLVAIREGAVIAGNPTVQSRRSCMRSRRLQAEPTNALLQLGKIQACCRQCSLGGFCDFRISSVRRLARLEDWILP